MSGGSPSRRRPRVAPRHDVPPAWIKLGAAVTYHRVPRHLSTAYPPLATVVRSNPWQLGDGTWVVLVVGVSGGVACDALTLAPVAPPARARRAGSPS
jgi:hypothetical protein